MNYYNEFDPHAAAWLKQLITDGLIPQGVVDDRSIKEVQPADLAGFTQCHFFCGIGGWPLALDLAGWDRTRPVWTGSCPCQPFSAAGKQKGQADERHLWPDFFRLIRECRPDVIFGEQVASAIRHGWLDGIQADLEGEGYACGHCVLGAHSVGAPHIRQRLYWVANSGSPQTRHDGPRKCIEACSAKADGFQGIAGELGRCSGNSGVANAGEQSGQRDAGRFFEAETGECGTREQDGSDAIGSEYGRSVSGVGNALNDECHDPNGRPLEEACDGGDNAEGDDGRGALQPSRAMPSSDWVPVMFQADCDPNGDGWCRVRNIDPAECDCIGPTQDGCEYEERDGILFGRMVYAGGPRLDGYAGDGNDGSESGRLNPKPPRSVAATGSDSHWSQYDLIPCRDGKARRIEPGLAPLAYGVPARVVRIRGYGNAIVPQTAAAFIEAFTQTEVGAA